MTCCVQLDPPGAVHLWLDEPPETFCRPKVRSGRRVPQNQIDFFPLFFFVVESGCYSFAVFVVVLLNLFVLALCSLSFCLSFWRCVGSLAVATAERL